jgi:hypothetical protein
MVVDKQGWQDAAELLAGTLDRLIEIQTEAAARLGESDEEGMHSKVLMLHFKSPNPDTEADVSAEVEGEAKPAS